MPRTRPRMDQGSLRCSATTPTTLLRCWRAIKVRSTSGRHPGMLRGSRVSPPGSPVAPAPRPRPPRVRGRPPDRTRSSPRPPVGHRVPERRASAGLSRRAARAVADRRSGNATSSGSLNRHRHRRPHSRSSSTEESDGTRPVRGSGVDPRAGRSSRPDRASCWRSYPRAGCAWSLPAMSSSAGS